MNEEIKSIFGDSLTVGDKTMPVAHLTYKGPSKTFVTWTVIEETPALSANDEDLISVCGVDIDIFSDGNYSDIVKEVKKTMKKNEWVWTGDRPEMYEEETRLYHKTCSFEKERIL
mgnify:FL=1